jgi:hypothetical protein
MMSGIYVLSVWFLFAPGADEYVQRDGWADLALADRMTCTQALARVADYLDAYGDGTPFIARCWLEGEGR